MIEKMLGIDPAQIKEVAGRMQEDLKFFKDSLDYHSDELEKIDQKIDLILAHLGITFEVSDNGE